MQTLSSVAPTLRDVALSRSAIEDPDRDATYLFNDPVDAATAARDLGSTVSLPDDRPIAFRATRKGNKVVAEFERRDGDAFPGATPSRKKWTLALGVPADRRPILERVAAYDGRIRFVVAEGPNGLQVVGRVALDHRGEWVWLSSTGDARNHLLALGVDRREVDALLGLLVECPFRAVHIPFGPEYPGERQWNFAAPRLQFEPSEGGDHPHWDSILTHCFGDLDEALQADEWAKRSGIDSGAKYGLAWVANLFRYPFHPLPYLFLFGEQNSGKSIFHEALALLMTRGVAAADRALTNSNDFNGELANAVLAYVEEKNVATSPGAYAKLKDWVTSPTLTIRRMRTDAYRQPNTLHFVQCANEADACPSDFGDTRITMMHVGPLEREIPKPLLIERLKEEAPAFMRTVLDLPLPTPEGRMRLPAIRTAAKERAALASVPDLAQAIVAAMSDRDSWSGVAKELPELLGAGDWPTDARVAKRELQSAAAYLRHHGLATAWTRTNAGQRLSVAKVAA